VNAAGFGGQFALFAGINLCRYCSRFAKVSKTVDSLNLFTVARSLLITGEFRACWLLLRMILTGRTLSRPTFHRYERFVLSSI